MDTSCDPAPKKLKATYDVLKVAVFVSIEGSFHVFDVFERF